MTKRQLVSLLIWAGVVGLLPAFPGVHFAQEPPPRETVTPVNPADVPPRPTLAPTPRPTPAPPQPESRAQIVLAAGSQHNGHWAVVQWMGAGGIWQDIEGWRGHIENGQISWRVLTPDFGKSPYRWTILDEPDGVRLCASEPFQLPGDWLAQVTVEIDDCSHTAPTRQSATGPSHSGATSGESLYVLRVRHNPDGSIHFTIHNIDTFETWFFSSFDNLQRFLLEDR